MVVPPCYGEVSGFCVLRILRSANLFKIGNRNGANGMSDMAGNAARVAVECGGRCRDTNRQSKIRSILFKNKADQFRTDA